MARQESTAFQILDSPSDAAVARTIEIVHELAPRQVATTSESRFVKVSPSSAPTLIKFKSTVVADAASRFTSPDYIATVRRRKAATLIHTVDGLAKYADADDFAVHTFPVVERLHALLDYLLPAKSEGNTRTILRYVRDAFVNGGWNRFKVVANRDVILDALRALAIAEHVTAVMADQTFDMLYDAGLDPVVMPGLIYGAVELGEKGKDG